MKTRFYFGALLGLVLLCSAASSMATTGWVWATRPLGLNSMHTTASVIDPSGNIYNCGNSNNYPYPVDSFVFGAQVVRNTSGNLSQLLITKTNAAGVVLWALGSQRVEVTLAGAATDNAGNLLIVGLYVGDTIQLGTIKVRSWGSANQQSFIAKIDPSGTVLWLKNILNRAPWSIMPAVMHDIAIDGVGNAYVTGTFNDSYIQLSGTKINHNSSISVSSSDVYLAKFNTNGQVLWCSTFGGDHDDWNNTGGGTFGKPTKLFNVTRSGNTYLVGESFSDSIAFGTTTLYNPAAIFPAYGPHINYFVKCDSNGRPYWATTLHKYVHVDCIITDDQEQVYMCGSLDSAVTFGSTTIGQGGFICKFDSSGHSIWAKSTRGGNGNNLCLDTARHIFMTGAINDTVNITGTAIHKINNDAIFIAEFDTAGTAITAMQAGAGAAHETFVNADKYGNIFVAGALYYVPVTFGATTLDTLGAFPSTTFTARYRYAEYGSVSVISPVRRTIDVDIFPNPATSVVTITAGETISDISITDHSGRLMYRKGGVNAPSAQVSIADLPSGIYYVSVNGVMARKLVKL